jgi:hypothetical protein
VTTLAHGGKDRRPYPVPIDVYDETMLDAIRRDLPGVRRVSSYCLPCNVRKKSAAETDGKRHRIAVGQENALDALPKFLAAAADAFEDFLFATPDENASAEQCTFRRTCIGSKNSRPGIVTSPVGLPSVTFSRNHR